MNEHQKALNFLDWYCEVEHQEEQKLLQELVDKEAPMKPHKIKYHDHDEYRCKKCGSKVLFVLNTSHERYCPYCPICGQRQDWSECDEKI